MIKNNFWQISDSLIKEPESVYYSPDDGLFFVANVVGGELDKDGQGWISKVSPEGQLITAKWVEGLNAPHGMRAYQGELWVADIDELVSIDIESGTILQKIPLPDAEFLNDVAISGDGKIFVSDTLKNRIYQVQDGNVTIFAEGKELESPNGIFVSGNDLFVAGWGNIIDPNTFETDVPGNFFKLDLISRKKQLITKSPLGNLDGVEQDKGGKFLVTDYVGEKLYVVNPQTGKVSELISGLAGVADLGFSAEDNLIVVPSLSESTVTAYDYTPSLSLNQDHPSLLELSGDFGQAKLQVSLSDKDIERQVVHEVGVFVVDDLEGRINNLLPGQDGYLQAALGRTQTIFSVIPDNFTPNPGRILQDFSDQYLSFMLLQDTTLDQVLADPSQESKVLLGTPVNGSDSSVLQITTQDEVQFQLSFEDGLGDPQRDLVLTANLTDQSPPIGTQIQGQPEGELVDLRNLSGQELQGSLSLLFSEADYENTVGLYQVENKQGAVREPLTGELVLPGEEGYAQAALRSHQQLELGLSFGSNNITGVLPTDRLYAPFIIADGTLEGALATFDDNDPDNDTPVYFSYLGANGDGVDHVRLLGDNIWGFEDLPNGGDQDFNDIVMQLNFV